MTEIDEGNTGENDEKKWIWGIFYFNRGDKRIFPRKRRKSMGWTVNFANPYSIIANLMLVVAAIYIASRL